jgi:hypothetical protein
MKYPQIGEHDLCPCDSGKKASACCRWENRLEPRPHLPPYRAGRTGTCHAKCYAKTLHDCVTSISKEHYISAILLRRISTRGRIKIHGFPWQGKGWKEIPISSFCSNILCVQHNSDLSGLDSTVVKLADRLARIDQEMLAGNEGAWLWAANGHDIERWLLKTLCGLIGSGSVLNQDGTVMASDVPDEWVKILYGLREFPPTWGLYMSGRKGHKKAYEGRKIELAIIWSQGKLAGITARLGYFDFTLIMTHVPQKRGGELDADSIYRAASFVLTGQDKSNAKILYFHWDNPGEGASIEMVWEPPPDEPAPAGAASAAAV